MLFLFPFFKSTRNFKKAMKRLLLTLLLSTFYFFSVGQKINSYSLNSDQHQRIEVELIGAEKSIQVCNFLPGEEYTILLSKPLESNCPGQLAITGSQGASQESLSFTAVDHCMVFEFQYDCPDTKFKRFFLSISKRQGKPAKITTDTEKEIQASIVTSQNSDANSLVQDVFIGGDCFEVSGVSYSGTSGQLGSFSNGLSSINIEDGVIISTGAIGNAVGPNTSPSITTGYFDPGTDSDLDAISGGGALYDIAKIEFDFTPTEDQITFEYAFASDEYCEFAGTQYNDVFGFFISGPGINGPYSNNSENIAIIPGTGDNVAINSINHYTNVAYYLDNAITESCGSGFPVAPSDIEFDGFTTVLTAIANVIPCETYHIKLIIADRGDDIYDSAVFLKANSFGGDPEANVTSEISGNAASDIAGYEGCSDALITFSRVDSDLSEDLEIFYTISNNSTATAGLDYEALPGSVIIPAGQLSITISIEIYLDLIAEGMETIFIELQQACSCEASLVEVQIFDAPAIEVSLPDLEVCADQPTTITPVVTGGIPPLTYEWNDGSTGESIEVNINQPTTYSVNISDDCNSAEASTFTVVPIEETAVLSGDGQLCGGDETVNFTVDFSGTGPWNITISHDGNPTTVNNITSNPYIFTASQPGTYALVSAESASGCPVDVSGQAVISEASNTATLSGDGEICGGATEVTMSINLTGGGPWHITYAVNGNPITISDVTDNPFFFDVTEAGTYELISVESADGCPVEVSGQGSVTQVVNTATLSGQGEICGGSNSVTMTVDLPGAGPWNIFYTVNGNQESIINVTSSPYNFEGTIAGTYQLNSVESADGCPIDVSGQGTITEVVNTATLSGDGEVCGGTSSVEMSVNLPGPGPWHITYAINGQQTTVTDVSSSPFIFEGSEPGNYQLISVESADGCPIDVSGQGNISESQVTISPTTDEVSCNGGTDGMIQLTPQGGTAPYVYDWGVGPSTDPVISDLSAGAYFITVYDAFGCEGQVNVQITEPTQLSAQVIDIEDVDCSNLGGSIALSASGGTGPYDFLWEDGSNTTSQSGLNPGDYFVTVLDDNGCETLLQATVQDLIEYPIAVAQANPINCYDDQAIITAQGSTTENVYYNWFAPNGASLSQNGLDISVGEPGIYTFVVTNFLNQCETEYQVEVVTDLEPPVVNAGADDALDCINTDTWLNGTTATADPLYLFQWFTPDGNIMQGEESPNIQVDEPGLYILSVLNTENGCVGEDEVLVEENVDLPEIIILTPEPITCSNTEITLSGFGSTYGPGIEYEWSTSDGNLLGSVTGEEVLADASGNYELLITNTNNGCANSMEIFVPIDTIAPVADAGEDFELDCYGNSLYLDGSNSSSGSNYSYEWTTSDGTIIAGDNGIAPETDAAGIYTLVVTNNDNGCLDSDQAQVFNSMGALTLSANVGDILNCYNSSIDIDGLVEEPGAQYSVLWTSADGNPIVNPGNLQITVSNPGIYQMEVTNTDNGCVSNYGVEVFQDIVHPVALAGQDQIINCYDNTATLDANGSDFGDEFSITWLLPDGSSALDVLSLETDLSGTFTLEVINSENGCVTNDQVDVIPDFDVPIANAGQDLELNCLHTTLTLSGNASAGGDEMSFEWLDLQNNVLLSDSTMEPEVAEPGWFTLSVANLDNGCANSDTVYVGQNIESPIAMAEVEGEINCANDEVNLLSSASSQGDEYAYQWGLSEFGIIISNEASYPVDYAGTYQLVVTNIENHCVDTAFVQVSENFEMPLAEIADPDDITCQQLAVDLDASASSAGNEFQYIWTLPDGSTINQEAPGFNASSVGSYTLQVLNTTNGCTDEASVDVISLDELPTAEAGPSQLINCYESLVTLNPSGSSVAGNYSYTWQEQNGATLNQAASLQTIEVSEPGIYEFIVTDLDNGCASADAVIVNIDIEEPTAEAGAAVTLTCSEPTLNLDASQSSQGNISLEWSTANGVILSGQNEVNPLIGSPGLYNLMVINLDNGCQASDLVQVSIDTIHPEIDVLPIGLLTCDVTSVDIQSTTGGSYDLIWLDVNGNEIGQSGVISVETPGFYTLIAEDANNGCESSLSAQVWQNITPPVADAGATSTLTCATTSLQLDGTGSSGNGDYQWSTNNGNIVSGSTGLTPVINQPGVYTILVTDDFNGCQSIAEVAIAEDTEIPQAIAANDGMLTCTNTEVSLMGTSNVGNNFEYEWQYANGQPFSTGSLNTTVTSPGTYQFYVFNPVNGCENSTTVSVEQDIEYPVADAGEPEDLTCIITNLTLDGSVISSGGNNFTYEWTGPTNGIIANPNSLNPIIQEPGTYTLLVTNVDNGCTDIDVVAVDLIAPTGIEVDLQQPLCHGEPAYLDVQTIEGGADPYVFSINGGSSFTQTQNFTLLSPGWHLLVVQDANGCEFTEGVFVEDIPEFEIELDPLAIIKLGEEYQINATVNVPENELASITWTPADSLSCSDCLTPVAAPHRTTNYLLEVITENGCLDEAWFRLIVDERPAIYIPNVFSPNGDGTNEIFHIFARDNTVKIVNSLQIFTRWGEMVFEVYDFPPNDPQFGWDGYHRGVPVNSGVFVYWTEVELINGQKVILKGDVTIIY